MHDLLSFFLLFTIYKCINPLQFQTLNKEQGIQWVKRERLPLFLESDYYLEYRLAKLVSQAQVAKGAGDSVSVQLDYAPRVKNTAMEEEVEEEEVDETEVVEVPVGG